MIEKIRKRIETSDYKSIGIISIFITVLILFYINPYDNIGLTTWDRSFCPAIINSMSIGKRVSNVYRYFYLLAPFLSVLGYIVTDKLIANNEVLVRSLRNIAFISSFGVIIAFLNRFSSGSENHIIYDNLVATLLSFYVSMFVCAYLSKGGMKVTYDDYIVLFINHIYINILLCLPFGLEQMTCVIASCIASFFTVIDYMFIVRVNVMECRYRFLKLWSILYYGLFVWTIGVEALYIVSSRGYIITHPVLIVAFIMMIFLLSAILYIFKLSNTSIEKVDYLGVVISLAVLFVRGREYSIICAQEDYTHIFELENISVSLETITRGKLPLIDYFPAHALQDVFSSLLYWICGGDIKTAVLANPWDGIWWAIGWILLFLILRQVFDNNWSILILLLLPFGINNVLWPELAFVAIVGVLGVYNHSESFRYYVFFWMALILCAISRWDVGISIAIGCILTGIILAIVGRISFKKSVISALISIGPFVLFYIIYCAFNGISCFGRILEWIEVGASSSSTWATDRFGYPETIQFFIAYELVPIINAMVLVILIFLIVVFRNYYKSGVLALIFSITNAFMVTRTLVFHNLYITGGKTGVVLNFFYLVLFFFSLYLCEIYREHNVNTNKVIAVPCVVLAVTLIIATVIVDGSVPNQFSTMYGRADRAASTFDIREINLPKEESYTRTELSQETKNIVDPFITIFDILLEDSQTFIDFANMTGLYALCNRECPSYVVQTPSLLAGVRSHEYYLDEIKSVDAPIAIIGNAESGYLLSMDGARNNVRYYKIAEYIYTNYRPLVALGDDFAIWCWNDTYDLYCDKLTASDVYGDYFSSIDWGYDQDCHAYSVGDIPYIWANIDDKNAADNGVLCEGRLVSTEDTNISNAVFELKLNENSDKSQGNYLYFECDNQNNEDVDGFTILSSEDGRYSWEYNIKPGYNSYLIRISSDNTWYYTDIDRVEIGTSNEGVSFNNVRVLVGD